jgi:hypothetical protein
LDANNRLINADTLALMINGNPCPSLSSSYRI